MYNQDVILIMIHVDIPKIYAMVMLKESFNRVA